MNPRVAVCWDVDGTLLHGGPIGGEVLAHAFTTVTGHPVPPQRVLMPGRTDWLIGEGMRDALDPEHAAAVLARGDAFGHELIAAVSAEWERRAHELAAVSVTMPGIPEVVAALADEPGVVQTLATGNTRVGARAKLAAVGLAEGPIDIKLGGYGEGPGHRERVVHGARAALTERFGATPALVVVGDTPLDVEAAHRGGAIAVAVATGGASLEELRATDAELVLTDLSGPAGRERLVAAVRAAGEDQRGGAR